MSNGLNIRKDPAIGFSVAGRIGPPARSGHHSVPQGTECKIHVSGGEFNVAANLSDCFGMRTAIVSAMVGLSHRRSDRRARARHGREAAFTSTSSTTA